MSFRRWFFIILAVSLLSGVYLAQAANQCGWEEGKSYDCYDTCNNEYHISSGTCYSLCYDQCKYATRPPTPTPYPATTTSTSPTQSSDSHPDPRNCGWTLQQGKDCVIACYQQYDKPFEENKNCADSCSYCISPVISPESAGTTVPTTTGTPVNCQALYSACIQSTCPGVQGNKACYDSCQKQVEVGHGSECVLLPEKIKSMGNGNIGEVTGDVLLTTANGQSSVQLKDGDVIPVGSKVITNNGNAKITFADGTPITLRPHTTFSYASDGYRLTAGQMKNFALCSLENLASGSFACPPIFTPVARFTVRGGTS